jgi:SAM-dependent methyltransferase
MISSLRYVLSTRSGIGRLLRRLVSSRFRREESLATKAIASIPSESFRSVEQKYAVDRPGEAPAKYLRIEEYMRVAASRAVTLRLDRSEPLRILDLGCGNGYFLALSRVLGHSVLGIDVPDEPMYNELIRLLDIPRIEHRIMAGQPLPVSGKTFDLITAYMICFNRLGQPDPWSAEEWEGFLDECRSHLAPGGRIRLEMNPDKRDDYKYLSDETAVRLRKYAGATVSQDKVIVTVDT